MRIMNIQISKKRQISTLLVFGFVMTVPIATLVTSPALSGAAVHDSGNQKSKDKNKPKDPKCNNCTDTSKGIKDSKKIQSSWWHKQHWTERP